MPPTPESHCKDGLCLRVCLLLAVWRILGMIYAQCKAQKAYHASVPASCGKTELPCLAIHPWQTFSCSPASLIHHLLITPEYQSDMYELQNGQISWSCPCPPFLTQLHSCRVTSAMFFPVICRLDLGLKKHTLGISRKNKDKALNKKCNCQLQVAHKCIGISYWACFYLQ